MVQVKKSAVRQSILDAASKLISERGYQATSMSAIASMAGITPGNIYRYYKSKFELFYDVLDPWLNEQLTLLEERIARLSSDRDSIREIFVFMWIELPQTGNNFAFNLIQALAIKKPEERYSRELLKASEARIGRLIEAHMPDQFNVVFPAENISHLIFMSHDGFVINARLADDEDQIHLMIENFLNLIFEPA